MVFGYYRRLSAAQKKVYRASDAVAAVQLPGARHLQPLAAALREALEQDNVRTVGAICRQLSRGITDALSVSAVQVQVRAVRPHDNYGELHGLYESAGKHSAARIVLWMRTARRRKVVAYRTFLRTLLHELCHHLDYEYLKLADSFHTEGFYKRESSLFHQLVPAAAEQKAG